MLSLTLPAYWCLIRRVKGLANVFDFIAAAGAVLAVVFLILSAPSIDSGPEFMQIGLFCLMLAVIPYCLAGAIDRISRR